ncbi:MAG: hypothetical protein WDW38_006463 [Sanguina aurantia]
MAMVQGDTFTDASVDDVVISANNGATTRSILAGFTPSQSSGQAGHSLVRLNVQSGLTIVGNVMATGVITAMGGFASPSGVSLMSNSSVNYGTQSPWAVLANRSNAYILGSNVGIGTSNPMSALEVVGNIHASGMVSAAGGFAFQGDTSLSGVSLTGGSTIAYAGVVGSPWLTSGSNTYVGGTSLSGVSLTGGSTIAYAGVVGSPWLTSGSNTYVVGSNVGIGTSTPKVALDVVGDIHASGVVSAAGGFAFQGGTSLSGVSLTGGSTIAYAGVVGSPWLTSGSNTYVVGAQLVSAAGGFAFQGDTSLSGVSLTGGSTIAYAGVVGDPWSTSISNTYVVGSNVGIGTSTPKVALDVVGDIHASGVVSAAGGFAFQGGTSSSGVSLTGGAAPSRMRASWAARGRPRGSNTYVVGSNVGIGTSTPKWRWTWWATFTPREWCRRRAGSPSRGTLRLSGVSLTGGSTIAYAGVVGSPWLTSGSNTYVVGSNVGIGTSTPKVALDVVGNIHASGVVTAAGGFAFQGDAMLSGISLTGGSTIPYSGVTGAPWLTSGSNTYVVGSNVGIGTTTPKNILDVVGNASVSGALSAQSVISASGVAGFWTLSEVSATTASGPASLIKSSWFSISPTNSYFSGYGGASATTVLANNTVSFPVKGVYNIGFVIAWATPPAVSAPPVSLGRPPPSSSTREIRSR